MGESLKVKVLFTNLIDPRHKLLHFLLLSVLAFVLFFGLAACDMPEEFTGTYPDASLLGTDKDTKSSGQASQQTTDRTAADNTSKDSTTGNNSNNNSSSDGSIVSVENEVKTDNISKRDNIYINVYYQDAKGYLIPISVGIPRQEGMARAAILAITDNPVIRDEIGYYEIFPVLPLGTKVRGMTIRDGLAKIDFTSELLSYTTKKQETSIITSIVYTLTEFDSVERVSLMVEGKPVKSLKFTKLPGDELNRDNVMINSGDSLFSDSDKLDIMLFKTVGKRYYVLPVSRQLDGAAMTEDDDEAKQQLIEDVFMVTMSEKPDASVFFTAIPEGTKLKSARVTDKNVELDFSIAITSYGGGSARETELIAQVFACIRQIKGIKSIKLLIEGGKPRLPEGTMLDGEILIPPHYNLIEGY